jgi:putative oxygen-independent coproporphyrinogen III oxidase
MSAGQADSHSFPDGPPPLGLYIHVPWCVRKCPYCDFNSHPLRDQLPEATYIDALLLDLDQELSESEACRPLVSIFIGGGTPSLLSGAAVRRLLQGIRACTDLAPGAELTLEANPGTVDSHRFAAYREAGINRLSIGIQSLADTHLQSLGRIHGADEARAAAERARAAGFDNINLDLMFGLPGQDLGHAAQDLEQALALAPTHLSYYQLTLEPHTPFFAAPPPLPDHDLMADMQLQGVAMLASAGYRQYEVSAYARASGWRCAHNLNYWQFGDYLGVGAGAHGKLTRVSCGRVTRSWKIRHPNAYLAAAKERQPLAAGGRQLGADDLVLELAMNALRLTDGFDEALFEQRTGLPFRYFARPVGQAIAAGMLQRDRDRLSPTELGRMFLNDLVQHFLP